MAVYDSLSVAHPATPKSGQRCEFSGAKPANVRVTDDSVASLEGGGLDGRSRAVFRAGDGEVMQVGS
jgi:hypothetical protein